MSRHGKPLNLFGGGVTTVDTPDGIINATCGLCFTTTGSAGTTGLCKIDNAVEVRYSSSILGNYYCIKAIIE